MSERALADATGHGWDHWFGLLDEWGGAAHSHKEIARWLMDEQGVAGWWSQSITVGYERARGLRAPGQRPDGWSITASKTVAVPVERLFEVFEDEGLRERWLAGAELRPRTATAPRSARYDWRMARPASSSASRRSTPRRAGSRSSTRACPTPRPPRR
jgi:hypothetical protein